MDNLLTEETMPEVEQNSSKGTVGELKSDDTKPTEQKVTGGHLMTNTEDSLRTNTDTKSSIKSGHENTEGPLNCKVNTIRQADQNSEPLCFEKLVQETGSEDLTRGKIYCETPIKMTPNDTEDRIQRQGKTSKETHMITKDVGRSPRR